MAFRYINPGYSELLSTAGAETVISRTYNPNNGVAFTASSTTLNILPAGNLSTTFFCKFDVYITGNISNTFFIGMPRYDDLTNRSWWAGAKIGGKSVWFSCSSRDLGSTISLNVNAVNSVVFGLNFNDATFEFSVNDGEKVSGNVPYASSAISYYNERSPVAIYFPRRTTTENIFVSNMIISDAEISPKEKIIALPISETITDMTAGASGIYFASAANQTLLQAVDVSTLIENFGASSTVTGIELVGNPAYRTGTGLTSLTALSKSNGIVTEHGTLALSEDTTAAVFDGMGLSGITIADLQSMQFGWKAGE